MTIDISDLINMPPEKFESELQKQLRYQRHMQEFGKYAEHITQEMRNDDVYSSHNQVAATEELPQCSRCGVYTNDPEHYCGSVALVHYNFSPQFWRFYFHWTMMETIFLLDLDENQVKWSYQNDPDSWFILPEK